MRNPAIEALRFIFMLQICCWHLSSCIGLMTSGFLGVEFYFFLAGVYIYLNTKDKDEMPSVVTYTYRKVKKFYLEYIGGLIIAYMVAFPLVIKSATVNGILWEVLLFIGQILFLIDMGPFKGGYNNPTWFFAILVWSGALVYSLVKDYRNISIKYIFPLCTLFFLSFCFNNKTYGLEQWDVNGFIPMAFIRGTAEIGFGVLVGYFYKQYLLKLNIKPLIINTTIIIAFILYFCMVFDSKFIKVTMYSFILLPVIIISGLWQKSFVYKIFHHYSEFWIFLGRLCFPMFLLHVSISRIFRNMPFEFNYRTGYGLVLYIITILVCSYIFMNVCGYIRHKIGEWQIQFKD